MYVAKRTFKVMDADGKIRMAQPGEDVPECDTWRNVRSWISRGFIELKAGTSAPQPAPRKTKPKPTKKPDSKQPEPAEVAPSETEASDGSDGSDGETEAQGGEKYTENQLLKMNKTEVQDIADTMGLNPDQNKADIVADIMEALKE